MIEIVSLNVGKPKTVQFGKKEVETGFHKSSTSDTLFLSTVNFEGDGQGDLVHHGGVEKAVCVYPSEHYPFWENELKRPLSNGSFGENLTLRGLTEEAVCIGDTFKIGEAVVQVSQPRQPCFKLSLVHELKQLPVIMQDTGYTGFYFRVLQEGLVSASDSLVRISRPELAISATEANRLMHHDKDDFAGIQRILSVKELSASWRKTFQKRLDGQDIDTTERLTGNK